MGCDIHFLVERRVKREPLPDQWVAVRIMLHGFATSPRGDKQNYAWPAGVERNYDRFAALAGVRGNGPAARGLPTDASDTARLLFKICGDHTPSWLPLADAAHIFKRTERCETMRPVDRDYPEQYYFNVEPETDGPIEDHRVVFWFDS